MAEQSDKLLIVIDAAVESLRRELQTGNAAVAQFERSVTGKLGVIDRSFQGLGKSATASLGLLKAGIAGAIGGLSLGALTSVVRGATQQMDDLVAASERVGYSLEGYQAKLYGFERLDVSAATAEKALQKLNVKLGDAVLGGKESQEAFGRLGLSLRDLQGLSPEAIFDKVASGLGQINDPAQRARIALDLFGKEAGPGMAAALADGGKALADFGRQAAATGQIIDDATAQRLAAANDRIDRFVTNLRNKVALAVGAVARLTESPLEQARTGSTEDFIRQLQKIDGAISITRRKRDALARAASADDTPFAFGKRKDYGGDLLVINNALASLDRQKREIIAARASANEIKDAGSRLNVITAPAAVTDFVVDDGKPKKAAPAKVEKDPLADLKTLQAEISATLGQADRALAEQTATLRASLADQAVSTEESLERQRIANLRARASIAQDTASALALETEAIRREYDLQVAAVERAIAEIRQSTAAVIDQAALKTAEEVIASLRAQIELLRKGQALAVDAVAGKENQDKLRELQQFAQTFAATAGQGLESLILNGGKVSDVFKNIAAQIVRLIIQLTIVKPLAEAIARALSGGGAPAPEGGGGNLVGSLVSGGVSALGGAGGNLVGSLVSGGVSALGGAGGSGGQVGQSLVSAGLGAAGSKSSSGQTVFQIDARGAEVGVEQKIAGVLQLMTPGIVRQAQEGVFSTLSRGRIGR